MRLPSSFTVVAVLTSFSTACSSAASDLIAPVDAESLGTPDSSDASGDASAEFGEAAAADSTPDTSDLADATDATDATDAAGGCAVSGAPGVCITVTACAALGDHTSTPGHCAGPADIECCAKTPNVADNPPIPSGYTLMAQSQVSSDMTTWAVAILHDPVTYPMFSTTTKAFPTLTVLARVEWHAPDFLNHVVHRGVTLYRPL